MAKSSASATSAKTAKTASGDAPAVVAREALSEFHHDIQFPATDLVQVAKAAMRFSHQLPEASQIAGTEAASALTHPLIFLYRMTASLSPLT